MEVSAVFSNLYEESPEDLRNLPGYYQKIIEAMKETMDQDIIIQWQNLLELISKLLKIWNRKFKKWEINSLTILMEKLSTVPGDILATSFSTEIVDNFLRSFKSYAIMEDLDSTECLDFQSKMTTSMSSMTVPSVMEPVEMCGGSKSSLLEKLGQAAKRTNQYGNSQEPIGTMSSSISFLENGELVKYGLEEKVGKHRLTLNWYDGKKSITLGDKWYEAKIAGAIVSVNDKVTKDLVEQLLCHVTMKFMAKNPVKQENSATYGRKRRRYY